MSDATTLPFTGPDQPEAYPTSDFRGFRLSGVNSNRISRKYLTYAVRKDIQGDEFNNGQALANTTTYTKALGWGRSGTITGVWAYADTVPVGAASAPLTVKRSDGTNLLNAASFDLTTLVAGVLTPLPLSAVAGALTLSASQIVKGQIITGTQTTQGVNVALFVEIEQDDF